MARPRKTKHLGRPTGSKRQVVDVNGCPWIYSKPAFSRQTKGWYVFRRPRIGGPRAWVTLSKDIAPEDFSRAYADVTAMATAEAEDARQQALPPSEQDVTPITLADATTKWFDYLRTVREVSAGTEEEYARNHAVLVECLGAIRGCPGGDVLVDSITASDLDELIKKLKAWIPRRKRKDGTPAKVSYHQKTPRTLGKYIDQLNRFLAYMVRRRHARSNVARDYEVPREWRRDNIDRGQALTPEQATKLLHACREKYVVTMQREDFRPYTADGTVTPPPNLHLAVAIGLMSGLRKGHIVGPDSLRWGDLDLTVGSETISIPKDRYRKGKFDFCVPIHRDLARLLREHQRSETDRLGRIPPAGEHVVGTEAIDRSFLSALKRAGLGDLRFRFHDLRHTYCSLLAETAPYVTMQTLMGHRLGRGGITERYAKHARMDVLRVEVNKLPSLIDTVEPLKKTLESS